jgi:hypothetical protein
VSTKDCSPNYDEQVSPSRDGGPEKVLNLRDLYVRASISGNSLAAELGRYLNIDENTFSSRTRGTSRVDVSNDEPSVHEHALAAILSEVIASSKAPIEYVRTPEPSGGVQEWWARMLSGSMGDRHSSAGAQGDR